MITGPNTGGKTVMLKTLGMAALMARAGLRVLCEPTDSVKGVAIVPFFEAVMADIGDDQSIVQSLSTFSAHVSRIRRILNHADSTMNEDGTRSRSLVLLDEVGSGTDPTEGSALGMAVLRKLAQDSCLTLATTHHGRLKSLKYSDADGAFENACVEFDVQSMAPTYRLLWGIPGRSNALAIAERLGLQEGVVRDARGLLEDEGDVSIEEVLAALQEQREEQRVLNAELKSLRDENAKSQAALAKRAASVAAEEKGIRETAQAAVEVELAEARAEIADLIKRARQPDAGGKAAEKEAQRASQELARLGEKTRGSGGSAPSAPSAAPAAPAGPLKVMPGDKVQVPRLGDQLVDVEMVKGSQITVVYGGLKMKVKANEIARVVKPAPPPSPPPKLKMPAGGKKGKGGGGGGGGVAVRFASNTLDLRGRYASEIDSEIGIAVDRAGSIGTLWVIHGHGTGALKKRVRELLKDEPAVRKLEDAPPNEGGAGCTVAYLK